MATDRDLQLQLLRAGAAAYPHDAIPPTVEGKDAENHLAAQLFYLAEHRLITNYTQLGLGGYISFAPYIITAAGLDFLADDGGLTAILGVVTVKLHEDTIKDLLIKHIESEPGSDSMVKSELIKQVKSLPAEGLKTLTTKTLEAGIAALPSLVPLIRTWLGGV